MFEPFLSLSLPKSYMELSLHAATVHVPRHVTGISVPMLASDVVAIAHGFASQGRAKKQRKGGWKKQGED
jgi:hypothetical protein